MGTDDLTNGSLNRRGFGAVWLSSVEASFCSDGNRSTGTECGAEAARLQ